MTKKTAPTWVLRNRGIPTQREWRRMKRAELKAVIKAVNTLRQGCAYAPTGINGQCVGAIDGQLKALWDAWSPKNWGA